MPKVLSQSLNTKVIGVVFEGVQELSMFDRIQGVWRCMTGDGGDDGILSLVSSLVSTMLWSLYSLVTSWMFSSPVQIISSEASPPALFILAKVFN